MNIPEHTVYYLEIVTPDVEGARKLYGKAYGWRFEDKGAEWGNSLVARMPNGSLCGIRAPLSEQEKATMRTYLRVADLDAAVEQARALGALILLEPMAMPAHGRIAIYLIGGVEQGLWQLP